MSKVAIKPTAAGVQCQVCKTEPGLSDEEIGVLEPCPSCKRVLYCRCCGQCLKCGIAPREKADTKKAKRDRRVRPDVNPEWGHNKPTGGLRYVPLEVPVRRVVTIKGRDYVISLLPLTHEIEFRQRRKHHRYRFSLEGILFAAARANGVTESEIRERHG